MELRQLPRHELIAELARRQNVPDEPFPADSLERIAERVRDARRRRVSQAHVLTADIDAVYRWIVMHGLDNPHNK